ncbi:hypothetical protein PFISCL1PPCAC_28987, partial [Pristionchus fissidentatus]
ENNANASFEQELSLDARKFAEGNLPMKSSTPIDKTNLFSPSPFRLSNLSSILGNSSRPGNITNSTTFSSSLNFDSPVSGQRSPQFHPKRDDGRTKKFSTHFCGEEVLGRIEPVAGVAVDPMESTSDETIANIKPSDFNFREWAQRERALKRPTIESEEFNNEAVTRQIVAAPQKDEIQEPLAPPVDTTVEKTADHYANTEIGVGCLAGSAHHLGLQKRKAQNDIYEPPPAPDSSDVPSPTLSLEAAARGATTNSTPVRVHQPPQHTRSIRMLFKNYLGGILGGVKLSSFCGNHTGIQTRSPEIQEKNALNDGSSPTNGVVHLGQGSNSEQGHGDDEGGTPLQLQQQQQIRRTTRDTRSNAHPVPVGPAVPEPDGLLHAAPASAPAVPNEAKPSTIAPTRDELPTP